MLNKQLDSLTGWWNTIQAEDFDKDGNMDLVLAIRIEQSVKDYPTISRATLHIRSGRKRIGNPILTNYIAGRSFPFAAMDDLLKEVPGTTKEIL